MDYTSKIKAYLEEEKRVIDDLNIDNVNVVMNIFENARLQGQRIFICGNGGNWTSDMTLNVFQITFPQ